MKTTTLAFALMTLLTVTHAHATPLRVKLLDQSGAGFPDVLVIVKSLEGKGEIFRSLTTSEGTVPERDLTPGLYRVIATCPYGICRTKVSEVVVGSSSVDLEIKIDVLPTLGNRVIIGPSEQITVQIIDAQDRGVASAEILVRDSDAHNERWHKANAEGSADVKIPGGAVAVTIVVLNNGSLTEQTVTKDSLEKLKAEGKKLYIRLSEPN